MYVLFFVNCQNFVIHNALIAAGPSRPDRGKAKNFFTALADGAAEPEPTKRKRKRSGRTSQAGATKAQDGNSSGSSDDGGAYDAEVGAQDEGEETEDSDEDMVVDGAEVRS